MWWVLVNSDGKYNVVVHPGSHEAATLQKLKYLLERK